MNTPSANAGKWTVRPSASGHGFGEGGRMFETLFERSADAIWLFDPRGGVFVDCNQAAVELMRAGTKERLLNSRPEDLSPPFQPDGVASAQRAAEMAALASKHGGYRFEWVARRLDGQTVPLEVLTTPIPVNDHNVYVVVSRDITERKNAEKQILELNQNLERRIAARTAELSASEAQLRTLIEHAPEAIVVFDGETGRFLSCNENAVRLYGLPREQLLQLSPLKTSPEVQPGDRRSALVAREKIQEALAGGTPEFEWMHRHADGRLVPCEVRLVRLPGDGPPRVRASITDTTDRKRRENVQRATFEISEAVHTAQDLPSLYERIHSIIRGLMPAQNFYIALLDQPRQMISFAYHVDERTPKPPPQPMNTGLTSVVLRTGKALLIGGDSAPRKIKTGTEVTFEGLGASYVESGAPALVWLGVPLMLEGEPIGVVAVQDYRDPLAYGEAEKQILTFVARQIALAIARKRAEAELLKNFEREKELGQLKSNFVSMVSHEFRTPLGIIQSSAEILRDYLPRLDAAEREEQLQSIVKSTRRMAEMMEEVLVLSRLDAGRMEFRPASLDLNALCRRIVEEVLTATERRCPIEMTVGPGLPAGRGDDKLLAHIFTNLLNNAVKYSNPGALVCLVIEREGREAICRIRDQGIGIPAADQKSLFTAFRRGANVGDRPGTGLGLVVVKRCIDLHRGTIQLVSEPGRGTEVTVRIPIFESNL